MAKYYLPVNIFATKCTQYLAKDVCHHLDNKISFSNNKGKDLVERESFDLSDHVLDCFSNDNIRVQIPDIRNHSAIVLHTQVPDVSRGIIELFALLDAIKNAQPKDIFVVFPYMPYSRSDIESVPRSSVMASWLAQAIYKSGVKKVMLLDPHAPHARHFFEPAADEITIIPLIVDYLSNTVILNHSAEEFVLVFPDTGAFERFGKLGKLLSVEMAYLTKTRQDNKENPNPGRVIGDVKGKMCWIVDDEILTGNTALNSVNTLISEGARSVSMIAVHPIMRRAGETNKIVAELLQGSPLEKIIFTNSIPSADKIQGKDKFLIWNIASLLAEGISRWFNV